MFCMAHGMQTQCQSKVKSQLGNTCTNIFTQGKFTKVVPMALRADAGRLLIDFTDDVGIPEMLVTDGASEFTGESTEFVKHVSMHACSLACNRSRSQESEPSGRAWDWNPFKMSQALHAEEESTKMAMGLWCHMWKWITYSHVMGMEQAVWLRRGHRRHARHQWMVGLWLLWSCLVVGLTRQTGCQQWPEETWMMAWSITLSWIQSLLLDCYWDRTVGFQNISQTCHSRWSPAGRNVQMGWQLQQTIGSSNSMMRISSSGMKNGVDSSCIEDIKVDEHPGMNVEGRITPDRGWMQWHDCWRVTGWWWWGSCQPALEHGIDHGCWNEWWMLQLGHQIFTGTGWWDCWSCTSWPSLWHSWAWDWVHRWSNWEVHGEHHYGEHVCTG